jgi:hypothetical protein
MSIYSRNVKLIGTSIGILGLVGLSLSYYYQKRRQNRLHQILSQVSKYSLHHKSPCTEIGKTHPHPPKERGVALVFGNGTLLNVFETVNLDEEIVNFVAQLEKSHSPLAEHIKYSFPIDPNSIQIGWIATSSSKSLEQEIINLNGKLPF